MSCSPPFGNPHPPSLSEFPGVDGAHDHRLTMAPSYDDSFHSPMGQTPTATGQMGSVAYAYSDAVNPSLGGVHAPGSQPLSGPEFVSQAHPSNRQTNFPPSIVSTRTEGGTYLVVVRPPPQAQLLPPFLHSSMEDLSVTAQSNPAVPTIDAECLQSHPQVIDSNRFQCEECMTNVIWGRPANPWCEACHPGSFVSTSGMHTALQMQNWNLPEIPAGWTEAQSVQSSAVSSEATQRALSSTHDASVASAEPSASETKPSSRKSKRLKPCEYCEERNLQCKRVDGTHACGACEEHGIQCSRTLRKMRGGRLCKECHWRGTECQARSGAERCNSCETLGCACSLTSDRDNRKKELNRKTARTYRERKKAQKQEESAEKLEQHLKRQGRL